MPRHDLELGDAELGVMRVLWERSPLTVREVLDRLNDQGRDLAYTTVQTFLTRLERKGCVTSDKSGSAFVYRPRVSRDQVTRRRVGDLLDELFDGAAGPMVLHLVESGRLSDEELSQLRRLIRDLDSRRP
ncbi:MAG: BlaI/MecI/CopY family transcriptional regulator [Leptolyngbya sp. PLA1]|nr:BlaI/MecI/CopY family transcriptional regulator [Leptolyngbya sp. PLA1]